MRTLALLLLWSCGGNVELILPVRPETQSMILAFLRKGEISAHALRGGEAYTGELDLDRDVSITAMLYDRTLEELAIGAGPLMEDPSNRPLPQFDRALQAVVRRGEDSAWSEIEELAPEVAAHRIAAEGCRGLHEVWLADAGNTALLDLERLDATSALMLSAGPRYHRIDASGAAEIQLP